MVPCASFVKTITLRLPRFRMRTRLRSRGFSIPAAPFSSLSYWLKPTHWVLFNGIDRTTQIIYCQRDQRHYIDFAQKNKFFSSPGTSLGEQTPRTVRTPRESSPGAFSLPHNKKRLAAPNIYCAEEEGFEPSIGFPLCRFSKPEPSTTQPLFQMDGLLVSRYKLAFFSIFR